MPRNSRPRVRVDGRGKVTVQVMDPDAQPPKNAWATLLMHSQQRVGSMLMLCHFGLNQTYP